MNVRLNHFLHRCEAYQMPGNRQADWTGLIVAMILYRPSVSTRISKQLQALKSGLPTFEQ